MSKKMIIIEYFERGSLNQVALFSNDIMDAVRHFKECFKAGIENGDITYISASEVEE
jgi:hypothetical protein